MPCQLQRLGSVVICYVRVITDNKLELTGKNDILVNNTIPPGAWKNKEE